MVGLPRYIFEYTHGQGKIEKAFWKFHKKHPWVFDSLLGLIDELKKRGHKSYGMSGLMTVMRFRKDTRTTGSLFKYNNNLCACYSRLIMQKYPEHEGFFQIRKSSEHITEDPEEGG